MKTKEFIKRVKELGYNCLTNESYIFISESYTTIATIAIHKMYCITLYTNDNKLGELCMEYARTPIDERGDEEKFYLQKIESFYDNSDEEYTFLNLDMNDSTFLLSDLEQYDNFKTQFTQKEIDKIKEEQHTDLSEFKQIPVEQIEAE